MPSTYTSPFASSFNAAVKRGASYNTAVQNIASRNNKTVAYVWNSLFKAGFCSRQRFNGQWIYFPNNVKKANATTWKNTQFNQWQWFCEWCVINGVATPEQFKNHTGSQKEFMTWCRKFFGRQFNSTTTKSSSRKSSTRKSSSKSRTTRAKSTRGKSKSYKFPASKKSSSTRRYRRAA